MLAMLLMPLPTLVCAEFFARGSFSLLFFALYYGIGLALMMAVFGLERLALNAGKGSKTIRSLELVFFIASLVGVFILSFSVYPNSLSGIFFTCICAFFLLYGRALAKKPANECLSALWLGIFCGFSTATFLIFSLNAKGEPFNTGRLLSLGAFVVVLVLAVFLRNQSNITSEFSRRRNENAGLSGRVRRSNTALSLVFCLIFLVFLFSVTTLTSVFSGGLRELLKAVIGFFKVKISGTYDEIPREDFDVFFSYTQAYETNDIVLTVIVSLLLVALVAVVIYGIVRFIVNRIRRFVNNSDRGFSAENCAYVDTFEEKIPHRKSERGTKKLLRRYRREQNPTEKFRLGYRLILLFLIKKGESLSPSSTTARHLEILSEKTDTVHANELITAYNSLRYNDREPSVASLSLLEQLVAELSAQK